VEGFAGAGAAGAGIEKLEVHRFLVRLGYSYIRSNLTPTVIPHFHPW